MLTGNAKLPSDLSGSSRRYAAEEAISRARSAKPWHEAATLLDPASEATCQRWGEEAGYPEESSEEPDQ
jgi:hypothetical protein